jgi:hypothetical protein
MGVRFQLISVEMGVRFQLIHAACRPRWARPPLTAAELRRSLRGPTHHVRKLKWFVWLAKLLKAIFRKPRHLAPKHHFKAARPGDHFLSERPEK